MKMLLFNYSPELDKRITNLSALPQGGGCTLLECTLAHDGYTLIAKQWRKGELDLEGTKREPAPFGGGWTEDPPNIY
jgi:hypothetical protein